MPELIDKAAAVAVVEGAIEALDKNQRFLRLHFTNLLGTLKAIPPIVLLEHGKPEPLEGFGWWDEHPDYSVADWHYECANDDTRQGYWGWVRSKIEAEEDGDAINS